MKLPRLDIPNYKTTLPVSLTEVTYRPYTVKEEKILLMAMQGDDAGDKIEAMLQVVTNCSSVDAKTCHPVDIEWLFLKIRSCAVSSMVEVMYNITPETCGKLEDSQRVCPVKISGGFDIGSVEIKNLEEMSQYATRSGDTWVVMITDTVGLQFKIVALDVESDHLYGLVQSVIDGSSVYPKEDFTAEEFNTFIDSFVPSQLEPVTKFLRAVPFTSAVITARCSVCKKEFKSEVTDIVNFLV